MVAVEAAFVPTVTRTSKASLGRTASAYGTSTDESKITSEEINILFESSELCLWYNGDIVTNSNTKLERLVTSLNRPK